MPGKSNKTDWSAVRALCVMKLWIQYFCFRFFQIGYNNDRMQWMPCSLDLKTIEHLWGQWDVLSVSKAIQALCVYEALDKILLGLGFSNIDRMEWLACSLNLNLIDHLGDQWDMLSAPKLIHTHSSFCNFSPVTRPPAHHPQSVITFAVQEMVIFSSGCQSTSRCRKK